MFFFGCLHRVFSPAVVHFFSFAQEAQASAAWRLGFQPIHRLGRHPPAEFPSLQYQSPFCEEPKDLWHPLNSTLPFNSPTPYPLPPPGYYISTSSFLLCSFPSFFSSPPVADRLSPTGKGTTPFLSRSFTPATTEHVAATSAYLRI